MDCKGNIKSDSSLGLNSQKALIEVDCSGKVHGYHFESDSEYVYTIYNINREKIITSVVKTKSFLKKLLGAGEIVFFKDAFEVCRITEFNKFFIYDGEKHPFNIIKDEYAWEFLTKDFCIKDKFGKAEFACDKDYLLPCLACVVYMYSWHIDSFS